MSKIDEFEQKIIKHGMTDEDFLEYGKLLKRVRGNLLKRQHCYTTAIQFSDEYAEQAVKLIQYGLENFEDGWFSTYTSYLYIGHIYEKQEIIERLTNPICQRSALELNREEYVNELTKDLLWDETHIDSFCYSAELEDYYSCYLATDEFSRAFVNSEFRLAVANIIISLHHGRTDEAKRSLAIAKEICEPHYRGKLHSILAKHKYYESLNATPESITFVKSIQI